MQLPLVYASSSETPLFLQFYLQQWLMQCHHVNVPFAFLQRKQDAASRSLNCKRVADDCLCKYIAVAVKYTCVFIHLQLWLMQHLNVKVNYAFLQREWDAATIN